MKGSVTIFVSMVFLLILSLLFSLVETVHGVGLYYETKLISEQSVETVFSDYNEILWDEYGILALDLTYGHGDGSTAELEQKMMRYLDENVTDSFYQLEVSQCALEQYGVLTDNSGAAFIKEAVKIEKGQIAEDAINAIIQQSDEIDETDSGNSVEDMLNGGSGAIASANAASIAAASAHNENLAEGEEAVSPAVVDDPFDDIIAFRNKTILGQVIKIDDVSAETIGDEIPVSKRNVNVGSLNEAGEVTVVDKAIYTQYLFDYYGHYGNPKKGKLQYELEYVIEGKESDESNLKGIVTRLLLLREAENLVAIMSDPTKVSTALNIATAIVAPTGFAAAIPAVQYALIAAWAYVESVLDVRLLLSGGTVAIVKTPEQWTSQLEQLITYLNVDVKAKDCGMGLTYKGYLRGMLMLEDQQKLAYRTMDLLECTLHTYDDYKNIKMDYMSYVISNEYGYESDPFFFSFVLIGERPFSNYQWRLNKKISYL